MCIIAQDPVLFSGSLRECLDPWGVSTDEKIVEAAMHGIDGTNKTEHVQNISVQYQDWDFWNSVLFAGTVYTTIGKTFDLDL